MGAMRGLAALVLSVSLAAAAGDPGPGATLDVANRKVFTFRATVVGSSPAERLSSARARLEQIPTRGPPEQVELRPVQLGSERGTAVLVGSRLLFTVAEGDVDLQVADVDPPVEVVGQHARRRPPQARQHADRQDPIDRAHKCLLLTRLMNRASQPG